jgi:hypothetical protein
VVDQSTRRELITLLGCAGAASPLAHGRSVWGMPGIGYLSIRRRLFLMQATSLAARLLISISCAMLAAPAVSEDTGVGPPPALAPGQAPPLPQAGPLAGPRSSDQVGFPTALTEYVISPTTLRPARVALGQKLFFEPRLSGDGTVSCATCHDPVRAFTDGRPVSIGIRGRVGQRNAPTILNALYNKHQFWDGRVATLEQQAALPITNPFEMGSPSLGDAVSRIAVDKDYQTQFMQAFGRAVNEQDMLSVLDEPRVSRVAEGEALVFQQNTSRLALSRARSSSRVYLRQRPSGFASLHVALRAWRLAGLWQAMKSARSSKRSRFFFSV